MSSKDEEDSSSLKGSDEEGSKIFRGTNSKTFSATVSFSGTAEEIDSSSSQGSLTAEPSCKCDGGVSGISNSERGNGTTPAGTRVLDYKRNNIDDNNSTVPAVGIGVENYSNTPKKTCNKISNTNLSGTNLENSKVKMSLLQHASAVARRSKENSSFANEGYGFNGASSNGNISRILNYVETMEKTLQGLQEDVAQVDVVLNSKSYRPPIPSSIIRSSRSGTVRSSIILKDIETLQDELQGGSDTKYPADCYTLIGLNGPMECKWPKQKIMFFLYGLMVFFFEIGFLILMILSRVHRNTSDVDSDNPIDSFFQFIPANSKHVIRISQFLTLLTYTMFPDATLMDVFRAYQYFPNSSLANKNDPVTGMKLSCILRGFQGYLATIAVFLVVITTQSVVDIILNFTALNFISGLDDEAFGLAKSGVFGSNLRKEVERIEDEKLPACMTPNSTVGLYWRVMGSTAAVLFALLFCVIGLQNNPNWWITPSLRVEFGAETGLNLYSGCYEIKSSSRYHDRFTYGALGGAAVSFGYCNGQWVLFEDTDNDMDPCEGTELAHSTETELFDIASSFKDLWFYPSSTTPIDLFFFPDDDVESLYCDMALGDGVCDQPLNEIGYEYDNGDCCAPTCTQPNCGTGGQTSVFGNSDFSGHGFPNCENPQLKAITIHLNSIVSSRDPQFTVDQSNACAIDLAAKGEAEWRAEPPVNPILYLNCDDIFVLAIDVDKSMENHAETVYVKDGAHCTFAIRNSTSLVPQGGKDSISFHSFYCNEPIWYVNYTIFHDNEIEILTQQSNEKAIVTFQRVPECFMTKIGEYVDTKTIYTASNRAIDWLLRDTTYFGCHSERFIERFALSTSIFAMNGNASVLNNTQHQCRWWWTKCTTEGHVYAIDLHDASLEGPIPNELALLTKLEEIFLHENQMTSISSNMGSMKSLKKVMLNDNDIKSIPSEIGLMENLEMLWLNDNEIELIPTEIGSLSNLRDLELASNQIMTIPSEIGLLTNLEGLWFNTNKLTFVPSEIGLLQDLKVLWAYGNEIALFPSEIGLLTNLQATSLSSNNFTGIPHEIMALPNMKEVWCGNCKITNIPSEIWKMTDMTRLVFYSNEITSISSEIGLLTNMHGISFSSNLITSIPTEIGLIRNLEQLWMSSNVITSIPSEIGLLQHLEQLFMGGNEIPRIPSEITSMTGLKQLYLYDNKISRIPSEIGWMTGLERLYLYENKISNIPSEIGLFLTNLKRIRLSNNRITSIPTEIGLLTNLEQLWLGNNQIESIPSEIGLIF